jgi:hypothetical protein
MIVGHILKSALFENGAYLGAALKRMTDIPPMAFKIFCFFGFSLVTSV